MLKRTKKRKVAKNRKQEYIYEISDYFLDAEQGPDVLNQTQKPIIIPWSNSAVRAKDEDLLSYKTLIGMKVVCLGLAFDHWQSSSTRYGYNPVEHESLCTAHERKKRKAECNKKYLEVLEIQSNQAAETERDPEHIERKSNEPRRKWREGKRESSANKGAWQVQNVLT